MTCISEDKWIAPFGGYVLKKVANKTFEHQLHGYLMEVGGVIVDCGSYDCGCGRFMNDPFNEHLSNVKCCMRDGVIWMKSLKYIPVGGELLMSYGVDYWRVHLRFYLHVTKRNVVRDTVCKLNLDLS